MRYFAYNGYDYKININADDSSGDGCIKEIVCGQIKVVQ